ncbi:MAG: hypothetical protein M1831_000120 [Alyxoria varia]|nr:MAG: hypothetical protein M1831_000120 [Alyxoria varia]
MGLGSLKSGWQRQVKDFGHAQADKYTVLIVDNRGIGESDKPLMRYSTSEMAKDMLELLDHVGWTQNRSVHVAGISMGGMIAQELSLMIPERIGSLVLTSTAARIVNTIGYLENLRNRINLFIPKSIDRQIAFTKTQIFSPQYVDAPDDVECTVKPFPTNGDRFGAHEITKRKDTQSFTRSGFMCQLLAGGWHHKSKEDLQRLGDEVGRERIVVIHGTIDKMITFPHGETLLAELGGEEQSVRKEFFEGQSHVIPVEKRREYNCILEEMIAGAGGL